MPEPVPILLMTHSLGAGGGERQLALTALALDRARFQPHIACSKGGFWVERLRDAGVPFFFIQSRSLISTAALTEGGRLRRYIQEHRIRIVQTFDFSMNVFGIAVASTVGNVVTLSNLRCHMSLIPPKYRALNHWAHRISKAVVVNSLALRQHLIVDYKINPDRILTCHNGIDTDVFHPRERQRIPGLEAANIVIGTMCVLRPEKNLPLLLMAFAELTATRPDIRLLVVGSGPEEASLRELAVQLGITRRCVFHPSTPDVLDCLASIDIFVLPSLNEGLSNALMEAMACGCCAIASDVGGNPELISAGESGLLFPSNDRAALINQLSTVLDDPDLRQRLAFAGATRVQTQFSLDRAAQRMQEIYDTVLS